MRISKNTEYYSPPEPLKEDKWTRIARKIQKKLKKEKQQQGNGAVSVSVPDASEGSTESDNLIYVGGNYTYDEGVAHTVQLADKLYPVPEHILREDTESSFYIFRTDNNVVLARGVIGYDNAKKRASEIRKKFGLKFELVRFKKERRLNTTQRYRGGRVERSSRYNPSKRGYFKGVSYADGSYADLD